MLRVHFLFQIEYGNRRFHDNVAVCFVGRRTRTETVSREARARALGWRFLLLLRFLLDLQLLELDRLVLRRFKAQSLQVDPTNLLQHRLSNPNSLELTTLFNFSSNASVVNVAIPSPTHTHIHYRNETTLP